MPKQPQSLFKNPSATLTAETGFAHEVVAVPVAEEMSESFLAYSLSVITSRAIPDARDGLKPVQRRILYAMLNMGIRPEGPHRKSARVVGDTMGKYHPHGDAAIYDALVRLGQDFSRPITLIDPHGNFGTLDDPPAAPRYTECRLADAAMEMLSEIDEDTVDHRPTYDGEGSEPECLPGRLPNLLVNGTTGIAVGMATNMAPHNLVEVAAAIKLVMTKRRPKPSIEELMEAVAGPDFPSGGVIIDAAEGGLRQAYATGKGTFRIQAKMMPVKLTRSRWGIEVTELPYMVGPEKVVKRINELIVADKLPGVHDARNLSDRHHGLRVLIECEPHIEPHKLYHDLFRLTPLEETFAVNNVVLVNGVPTTVGLYDLCCHYIEHRQNVVVRRSEHRLGRARDRCHILEGLICALDTIDEVIAIIRGAADAHIARQHLQETLGLSEVQATHILDMQLRRLTALEKQKIVEERDELKISITHLEQLLGSEQRQRTLVLKELDELVDRFRQDRRTQVIAHQDAPVYEPTPIAELAPKSEGPCLLTLSTTGLVGRTYVGKRRRLQFGRHDVLASSVKADMSDAVLAVTSAGRIIATPVASLPEVSGRSRGTNAAEVFGTIRSEMVLTLVHPDSGVLMLVTAAGTLKRVDLIDAAKGKTAKAVIKLKPNDKVVAAFCANDTSRVVLISAEGRVLRTQAGLVPVQGRSAFGVVGMKLRAGDQIIAAAASDGDEAVIAVDRSGSVSLTNTSDIALTARGGVGTKLVNADRLVIAVIAPPTDLLAEVADNGKPAKAPILFSFEDGYVDSNVVLNLGRPRW
ncbi:MAG: DNA topoisomerase 4 subunit A [Acidimicrobiia bacterium]|nr:DNA topoisomerase 4 subunit A [Acidimicrobiia bacterium]MYC57132.1 DNA topoisomerase 4 subunit A [Acidimicrobiia bacterium]MYG94766.1 DNA topoisomerase 4 subunit A [Acidimicrobiia bacterium]MYI30209.1 DNA topoisomerase 4 subunit A [Acidimicrobiia bacterium]